MATTLGGYYFGGALLSFLASLFVIVSYIKFKAVRKHPSSLIFYRSIIDVVFSMQFLVLLDFDGRDCTVWSLVFQFTMFASIAWYFMIAIDLFIGMRDPFTPPSANIKWYHACVWGFSTLSTIVLLANDSTGFRSGMEVCWIQQTDDLGSVNVMNWTLFFIPTLIIYFGSLLIIIYASVRLSRGLDETFQVRQTVLRNGQRYVLTFVAYWTIAGSIYFAIYLKESDNEGITASDDLGLYGTFAVLLSIRGLIDVAIWTYNQRVIQTYRAWWNGTKDEGQDMEDINRALRKELLLFSTQGIAESVRHAATSRLSTDNKQYPVSLHTSQAKTRFHLERAGGLKKVPFDDWGAQIFRYLRQQYGITDEDYLKSVGGDQAVMIEKFTEGASGSFFYFTADSRFIVKTLTKAEADVLVQFLPHYFKFMVDNPDSLITKLLGFHSVQLYNVTLFFVVMQSVFQTERKIHQRYDIKGSWVNRHAKHEEKVYKDNDLNFKLSLPQQNKEKFLKQIELDARFLQSQGIMDYSLLLGVHNTKQLVVPDKKMLEEMQLTKLPFHQLYDGGMHAQIIEGPGVYFFGIIDILQTYNRGKKVERCFKVYFRFQEAAGISAIDPETYADRFLKRMHEITEGSVITTRDDLQRQSIGSMDAIELVPSSAGTGPRHLRFYSERKEDSSRNSSMHPVHLSESWSPGDAALHGLQDSSSATNLQQPAEPNDPNITISINGILSNESDGAAQPQ